MCRKRSPPRCLPPNQRVTTTMWSRTPSRASIRRMAMPAPASPSFFSAPSLQSSAQELWVALANFLLRLSSVRKEQACSADVQTPSETEYFNPRSLMMFSIIRIGKEPLLSLRFT